MGWWWCVNVASLMVTNIPLCWGMSINGGACGGRGRRYRETLWTFHSILLWIKNCSKKSSLCFKNPVDGSWGKSGTSGSGEKGLDSGYIFKEEPTEFFFNMYLFLRDGEKQRTSGGGAERGTHRIRSRLQALELSAQSPTWSLNSSTAWLWPEPKLDGQPTEPPRRPRTKNFWFYESLES